jgi:acyl dehydratase
VAGNPKLDCASLSVGDVREAVLVENLTRTQIVQYAGAAGDFNPIHHDEVFATKAAGYPSVFAHGMLTMGLTGRADCSPIGSATACCGSSACASCARSGPATR